MSRDTDILQHGVGSTTLGYTEEACRVFSNGNCDARFRKMAIGRVLVFQRSCERH